VGAKASLSLKSRRGAAAPAPAAAAAPPKRWVLDAGAEGDEDALMDEDALLTAEEVAAAAPAAAAGGDDCEVGAAGRKACKNCSCGRAEAEAKGERVVLTQEMVDNPTSACGSCYLGDAFRCASCPYRGLPSFAPGQKVALPVGMLASDF
jgi:hypothetical protein